MSTKKSWKTRRLDWLYPSAPLRDTALASIRQLVIESAAGSVRLARPRSSVISWGCQKSVSGKYSRIRAGSAAGSVFSGVGISGTTDGVGAGFGSTFGTGSSPTKGGRRPSKLFSICFHGDGGASTGTALGLATVRAVGSGMYFGAAIGRTRIMMMIVNVISRMTVMPDTLAFATA